jgi:choline dehydrogenase-like flavoprotein
MIAGKSRQEIDAATTGPIEWELQGFMEEFANPANAVSLGRGLNRLGLPQTRVDYRRHGGFAEASEKHLKLMRDVLIQMGLEVDPKNSGVQPQRGDHAASTCRMSEKADEGVVNGDLRVQDVENLYCCSNAVFPSGAAVNPTLTVTALAIRLGELLGR